MATSSENIYDTFFFERLCPLLREVVPTFSERRFIYRVFDTQWPDLTLSERVRHIAEALRCFMPADFLEAEELISRISVKFSESGVPSHQHAFIFLQDYLERYGAHHDKPMMAGESPRGGLKEIV